MHMSKYAWILYLHNTFTGKNIRNTQSLLFGWKKPSPCAFLNYLVCITSENTCFYNLQATSGTQRTRKHYQQATTSRYLLLSFLHELHLQILPATNSSGFPLRLLAVFIFCWFLKTTSIPSSKQAHKITENLYSSLQQSRTSKLMEAAPRCATFAFEQAPTYTFSRAWASPSPSRQGCVPVLSSVPPRERLCLPHVQHPHAHLTCSASSFPKSSQVKQLARVLRARVENTKIPLKWHIRGFQTRFKVLWDHEVGWISGQQHEAPCPSRSCRSPRGTLHCCLVLNLPHLLL